MSTPSIILLGLVLALVAFAVGVRVGVGIGRRIGAYSLIARMLRFKDPEMWNAAHALQHEMEQEK